jgi:hypothetical protein
MTLNVLTAKPLHQTAQRILLLWQWLSETPLTLPAMQDLFATELNATVGMHTLRVYINTLRHFGCYIRCQRNPEPGQPAQYALQGHAYMQPVFQTLNVQDSIDQLASLGSLLPCVSDQYNWLQAVAQLCQWVGTDWHPKPIRQLAWWPLIQQAIKDKTLLLLGYNGNGGRLKYIPCLPVGGYVHRHRHYLRVFVADQTTVVALRTDKIQSVSPYNPSPQVDLLPQLRSMAQYPHSVELLFRIPETVPLPPLPDVRQVDYWQAQGRYVVLETRDIQGLQHNLLSAGLPFEVLHPTTLKQQIHQQLTQLQRHHAHG